jgi:hypothetical protein
MPFALDRKKGERGEKEVTAILAEAGIEAEPNVSRKRAELAGWDLRFHLLGREWHAEVKNDLMERRSGNVAIEFYNPKSGKPSGVFDTRSELWFHQLARGMFVTLTGRLLEYCSGGAAKRVVACGGDGNSSMFLFPADVIIEDIFVPISGADARAVLTDLLEAIA